MTQTAETKKSRIVKTQTGVVYSAGGDKTIRVTVTNVVKHPEFGKYIRRQSNMAVHDEKNAAAVGDTVEIAPCRRISKSKNWRLVRIIRKSRLPQEKTAE